MININLIAERRARKLREMALMRWSVFGLGVLVLFMVGLNIMAWFDMQANQARLREAQDRLSGLREERSQLQETVQELNQKGPLVELLAQVRVSEGAWMTILADVSHVIPHQAFITNLTASSMREGLRLRFDGSAQDEETVGIFMLALSQQTEWAETAELSSVSAERDREGTQKSVRFDFNVPVRGLLGGDLK